MARYERRRRPQDGRSVPRITGHSGALASRCHRLDSTAHACAVAPAQALTAAALISWRHNDPMRFSVVEPFDSGVLEAGSGHQVSWERVGNPLGKPAVVLHGGPGSGAQPWWRTYFDPDRYSVPLFNQRACGPSVPLPSTPTITLSPIPTHLLLAPLH